MGYDKHGIDVTQWEAREELAYQGSAYHAIPEALRRRCEHALQALEAQPERMRETYRAAYVAGDLEALLRHQEVRLGLAIDPFILGRIVGEGAGRWSRKPWCKGRFGRVA